MLNSLIEHLQKIKDFRSSSGQRYPLYFILIIVILGMAQGYTTPFLPENHLEMITEWQGFHPVFHR